MIEEPKQDIRALAQAGKATVDLTADLGFRRIDAIFHLPFDIAVAILLRIQFRGIGGVLHLNVGMGLQEGLYESGAVRLRAIPNKGHRTGQMTGQVGQGDDQLFGIDRAIKVAFVDLAGKGQRHPGRGFPAEAGQAFYHRGLPFGCPGTTDRFAVVDTKLILKHDFGGSLLRFFYLGPIFPQPGGDQVFITFAGPRLRLLHAPSHVL